MPRSKSFVPPTVDEVVAQGKVIGLPERECMKMFFFYESKDFMVGKSKMKQWKSALALWRLNYIERGGTMTKTVVQSKMPSRETVYAYAKEKGDTKGYAVSFYNFWGSKSFMNNGCSIDWKVLLGDELSKRREQ